MAQKVTGYIKLQIEAGKATPAPPVILLWVERASTSWRSPRSSTSVPRTRWVMIPVVITVYADRSFSFITKTPPAAVLIKKAAGINTASGKPNKEKVATLTAAQVEEIAKTKMPDLNAASLEAACSMVRGTCRSMGVVVEG